MSTVCRTFEIAGMHCASCAMAVDWELEDLEGVHNADTSYAKGRTEVVFDPHKVAESDLLAAIQRAGYTARAAAP